MKKNKVRITYKSGVQFDVLCDSYVVNYTSDGDELTRVQLIGMDRSTPVPKYWNISAIESVWELP